MLCYISGAMFGKAGALIPGGVSCPARAFASVVGAAVLDEGGGSSISEENGIEYSGRVGLRESLLTGHGCDGAVWPVINAGFPSTCCVRDLCSASFQRSCNRQSRRRLLCWDTFFGTVSEETGGVS